MASSESKGKSSAITPLIDEQPVSTPPPMFPLQQSYAKEIPLPKEAYGWCM